MRLCRAADLRRDLAQPLAAARARFARATRASRPLPSFSFCWPAARAALAIHSRPFDATVPDNAPFSARLGPQLGSGACLARRAGPARRWVPRRRVARRAAPGSRFAGRVHLLAALRCAAGVRSGARFKARVVV